MFHNIRIFGLIVAIPPALIYLKHRLSIRQGYKIEGYNNVYTDANNILYYIPPKNMKITKIKVPFLQSVMKISNLNRHYYECKYFDILYTRNLDKEILDGLKNNGMDINIWFSVILHMAIRNDDISIIKFLCENIPKIDLSYIDTLNSTHCLISEIPHKRNYVLDWRMDYGDHIIYNPFSKDYVWDEEKCKTYMLSDAIKHNKLNILKYLLEMGISPTVESLKCKHIKTIHPDVRDILLKYIDEEKINYLFAD